MGAASRASAAAASLRPGARCAGCFEGLVSSPALTRRAATAAKAAATRRPADAAEGCAPAPRVAPPKNAPPRAASPAVTARLRWPDGRRRAPPRAQKSGRPDSVIPVTVKALHEVRRAHGVALRRAAFGRTRPCFRADARAPRRPQAVQASALDDQVVIFGSELGNVRPSRAADATPPRRAPTQLRRAAAPRGAPAALALALRMGALRMHRVAASPPRIRRRAARFALRRPNPALPPRRVRSRLR